jgi:hypothetical protein
MAQRRMTDSQGPATAADHTVIQAHRLSPAPDPRTTRRHAVRLVVIATLLELVLILPIVDHLADTHPMIHFTQHGFIFAGGVLLGLALRDVQRTSRS